MRNHLLLILFFAVTCHNISSQGFLKRSDKNIVDGNGNNIILRGIGPGGWMLQEPYMLNLTNVAGNQRQIRARIEATIGKENTDTFYQAWLKNYMQKADVDSIKSYGFNSIRLPMHYNLFTLPVEEETIAGENTWLDKGFVLVDSLLDWCRKNQIYLILDMHATPGGQGKDAAISDYDAAKQSLWESEANRKKLIALWKKLAERYVNETWIGGYDLINEINWDFENSGNQNGCNCTQNTPLWNIYRELITAIRQVDKNHLIIIEGNCWGNNYSGLGTLASFDDNIAISFHKYWNYNNSEAIKGILDLRNSTNLPIWCGESGENSNVWYTQAISLLEKNNIGWAWWTYKKFSSTSGTYSVQVTPEYNQLVSYWEKGGTNPGVEAAKATLLKMADNLKIENCILNKGVIDAMFRQVNSNESRQFSSNKIPGNIFAVNYDYGRVGAAYSDIDTANYRSVSGSFSAWNSGYQFRNDGVDIETCTDTINTGYSIGWTTAGEWVQYTVNVDSTCGYKLNFRYASASASSVYLWADSISITKPFILPATGGWSTWKSFSLDNLLISKGIRKIRLYFNEGSCNVNYMNFAYSKKYSDVPFEITAAYTSTDGSKIFVETNSAIKNGDITSANFTISGNGENIPFQTINIISSKKIELKLSDVVLSNQQMLLSYSGNVITDTAGKQLQTITNFSVQNKRPAATKIPGKIEAENYYYQQGFTFETCTDAGGGQNAGYVNQGDFLDYYIVVDKAGDYKVNFRVAALNSGGIIALQLVQNNDAKELGRFQVTSTGAWQTYTTISGNVNLPEGQLLIRVYIANQYEFNINWFEFATPNAIKSVSNNSPVIYPNPASEIIRVSSDISGILSIYNLQGRLLIKQVQFPGTALNIKSLKEGFYLAKFQSEHGENINPLIIKR